jgi:hypothetical protein
MTCRGNFFQQVGGIAVTFELLRELSANGEVKDFLLQEFRVHSYS